jgi:tRNA pseudouridine65 synthase
MHRMLLHAWRLEFAHPASLARVVMVAKPDEIWQQVAERFGWLDAVATEQPS